MAKKLRGLGGRNYGGSKKGTNMNDLLKQAQKAQEEMDNLEDTFKNIEVSASAGGGAINVVATCDYRIKSIEVDQELKEEDFEILAPVIINVVCFRYKPAGKSEQELNGINERLNHKLNDTGKMYLTHTSINGIYTLRMVTGQTNVTLEHVGKAWTLIKATARSL